VPYLRGVDPAHLREGQVSTEERILELSRKISELGSKQVLPVKWTMKVYVKPGYRGEFPLGTPDWDCFALTEMRERRERERRTRKAARGGQR
jgi:hypothetical protein